MSLIMKTVKKLTNMEPLDDLEECIDKTCVLLRLEKLESATCEYLSSFHAYSDIFHLKTTEDLPCSEVLKHFGVSVSHISAAEFPVVTVSKEYENILKMWTKLVAREETVPVVLVCGGKGLGKSTFNRILLNQTLNQVDMVYYLDCDVGQSEFTPAGCVSLQKVTEPVLGPPFCHQQISESTYFFGAVSPADNPSCYLQYLARAFSDYRKLTNPAPLVINTMGWIEGLGHELLIDTIAITSPTLVVQLRSNIRHQNLPNLTPVYISNKPGWMSYMEKKIDIEVNEGKGHKCVVVNSAAATQVQQGRSYKLSAREQRELTLLGYLSADLDHGITLASCAPKIVTWNSVAIHICHTAVPTSQVLYAINASVVALCHADLRKAWQPNSESPWFFESMPVCQCLGFGFVRAINPETKQLYIVTPLTIESLSRVNALLKGALTLPDISLLKQRSVFQENEPLPPYVDQLVHSRVPFVLHPRKRMWRKIHTTYRSSSDLNTDAEHS